MRTGTGTRNVKWELGTGTGNLMWELGTESGKYKFFNYFNKILFYYYL